MATTTKKLENFIAGKSVPTTGEGSHEVRNAATGEVIAEMGFSSPADVDAAVEAAAKAFTEWKEATPSERSLALLRIADEIEERGEELSRIESENTGKPLALTISEEIPPGVDQIRFFAGAARMLEGRASAEYMAGHTSSIRREPVGVCGQVTPWNYPFMMAIWKFAPALAAGNTVVLKPSENTPNSTLWMAELMQKHLPEGVFNVVLGKGDVGEQLVRHEEIAMVSLTGSVRAGKAVAAAASDTLKRVHLELGGKAPVIVFDDADVAAAAEGIAGAGYFNAGQDCTAATRVLAGPGVHDSFVEALTEQAKGTVYGNPLDDNTYMGPVISSVQLERVKGFIEQDARSRERHRGRSRAAGRWRLLVRADGRGRPSPGRRDDPGRDLRAGDHRSAVRRRGAGARLGQRRQVRARLVGLDDGTTAARCGWPRALTSGAYGSTRTSRSSPRCRMAASSSPATARTSRSTASTTTRASST